MARVFTAFTFTDGSKIEHRIAWGMHSIYLVNADGTDRKIEPWDERRIVVERQLTKAVRPPQDVWWAAPCPNHPDTVTVVYFEGPDGVKINKAYSRNILGLIPRKALVRQLLELDHDVNCMRAGC